MTGGLVALLVAGSFLGGACSWALLTRPAYGLPAENDGGPEADRLIAEAMAAWRADVAGRIASRLASEGQTRRDVQPERVVFIVLNELERGGRNA